MVDDVELPDQGLPEQPAAPQLPPVETGADRKAIRDTFAAAALSGLIGFGYSLDSVPAKAFEMADLCMIERDKVTPAKRALPTQRATAGFNR